MAALPRRGHAGLSQLRCLTLTDPLPPGAGVARGCFVQQIGESLSEGQDGLKEEALSIAADPGTTHQVRTRPLSSLLPEMGRAVTGLASVVNPSTGDDRSAEARRGHASRGRQPGTARSQRPGCDQKFT